MFFKLNKIFKTNKRRKASFTNKYSEFIYEDKNIFINLKDCSILNYKPQRNHINTIISDQLIELKTIFIPIVPKKIMHEIVINSVKKHSTIKPDKENCDYLLISKSEKQYEVLTFLCSNKKILNNRSKKFTFFHIIDYLILKRILPETCSVIVAGENENIFFLYSFRNKKIISRAIYFFEDLKDIKTENLFLIDIFHSENKKFKNAKQIENKIIFNIIHLLKNSIFKQKGKQGNKNTKFLYFFSILSFLLLFFHFYFIKVLLDEKKLLNKIKEVNLTYLKKKSERGMTDEIYKEYINLLSKKSNTILFFKNLYNSGIDNIELTNVNVNGNSFMIDGFCTDDSKFENAIRNTYFFYDVRFTFTKRNNIIQFNISGKFLKEDEKF